MLLFLDIINICLYDLTEIILLKFYKNIEFINMKYT